MKTEEIKHLIEPILTEHHLFLVELTVSSAGIGYPFKVEQQYQKNLGKSVEIKLNDHTKLNGILLRFTPEEIVIEQEEKKIIEGSKRKQLVKTERTIVRKDIKDVVKF